jgi:hypothetical protein
MSDSDAEQLPDEIKEEANFLVFCEKQKVKLYSEEVLLVDFAELSKKMKPSTFTNIQEQKSTDFTECNTVTMYSYL